MKPIQVTLSLVTDSLVKVTLTGYSKWWCKTFGLLRARPGQYARICVPELGIVDTPIRMVFKYGKVDMIGFSRNAALIAAAANRTFRTVKAYAMPPIPGTSPKVLFLYEYSVSIIIAKNEHCFPMLALFEHLLNKTSSTCIIFMQAPKEYNDAIMEHFERISNVQNCVPHIPKSKDSDLETFLLVRIQKPDAAKQWSSFTNTPIYETFFGKCLASINVDTDTVALYIGADSCDEILDASNRHFGRPSVVPHTTPFI